MSKPLNSSDRFTKQEIAVHIYGKTTSTLNKYIKEGKVFEPPVRKSGRRPFYTLADVMKLLIVEYGCIKVEILTALLDERLGKNLPNYQPTSEYMTRRKRHLIMESFKIIRSDIINNVHDPVDLSKYLDPIYNDLVEEEKADG